nr:f box only protein 28 [Hymenolepis microstoma]
MPNDCLRKVFGFLSFHEVAQIRPVCRKFNVVAADLLKCEFCRLEQLVRDYRRELKLLLPRRESERRRHNMAGHADVLSAVETRISLLGMTIMRYVDEGYCSFFPGKVLDELRRVYVAIKSSTEPISRSTELLRELRDISSMAMEHFDEVLLPQIYESKLHRQQHSLNELAYQRRIRHLQSTSLLKNLSQSFPNLLDFGIGPPSSSSGGGPLVSASFHPSFSPGIIDSSTINSPSSNAENHQSQHEALSPDESLIATLTKQISTMQQALVALATSQRDMNDKMTRFNNVVISLGYRIHRLETGSGIAIPERRKIASLKRTQEDEEVLTNNNEESYGPSEPKRRSEIDLADNDSDQQALNLSSTSDHSSSLPPISHTPDPPNS